jgi:hypothetical protein
MDSFSAHGDHDEMLQFLDNLDRGRLKKNSSLSMVNSKHSSLSKKDWNKKDLN